MANFVEIKGLNKLLKKVKDMPGHIQKEIDAEIGFAIDEIRNQAIARVPANTGRLRQSIAVGKIKPMDWQITAGVHYAPYIEFGTGTLVSVPRGLESYALQFKGRGVRQVNLPARPFFFPPFFLVKPHMMKNIENIINNP